MTTSVDLVQTAPTGAVCSGSTLFASMLNLSLMFGNFCSRRLQQTTFSDFILLALYGLGHPEEVFLLTVFLFTGGASFVDRFC